MRKLIGFTGKKRSGKDTSARILAEMTGYQIYSFARPLKQICNSLFGLSIEHEDGHLKEVKSHFMVEEWDTKLVESCSSMFGDLLKLSKRKLTELFYTKVLLPFLVSENSEESRALVYCSPRQIYQNFGTDFVRVIDSDIWIKLAQKQLDKGLGLIISDVRFDNEAEWVESNSGLLVSVRREASDINRDSHESELGVSKHLIHVGINNDDSVEALQDSIFSLLEYYLKSNTISVSST